MGFEKNDKGQIVRKEGFKVNRKNYKPKAKLTGTPKIVKVNNEEIELFDGGFKINVVPASVNDVWAGRRFKTPYYEQYEKVVMSMLPKIDFPPQPWRILLIWGFAHTGSDWDNPIKPFQDILQQHYGFNDSKVYDARIIKQVVGKGKEFIIFKVKTFIPTDEIIF